MHIVGAAAVMELSLYPVSDARYGSVHHRQITYEPDNRTVLPIFRAHE